MVYCADDYNLTTGLFNGMRKAMGRPGMTV